MAKQQPGQGEQQNNCQPKIEPETVEENHLPDVNWIANHIVKGRPRPIVWWGPIATGFPLPRARIPRRIETSKFIPRIIISTPGVFTEEGIRTLNCESRKRRRRIVGPPLGRFGESYSHGVYAIAQAGWTRAVAEHVTQMRVTQAAGHFRAHHPEAAVNRFAHVLLCDGCPEAWPSCAGLELRVCVE